MSLRSAFATGVVVAALTTQLNADPRIHDARPVIVAPRLDPSFLDPQPGGQQWLPRAGAWHQSGQGVRTTPIRPDDQLSASDAYVVQLYAPPRTHADARATLDDLQRRLPTFLEPRHLLLQEAGPGRYLVLFGPWETVLRATEVCAAINTTGTQCLVRRQ